MSNENNPINTPQEDFEIIDRYLSGEMDLSEMADFEKRMQLDAELHHKVEEYKIYFKGVEEATMKIKLADFHQELSHQRKTKKGKAVFMRPQFLKYAAAVSILVLVAVGSWRLLNSHEPHEKLFAEYFAPDPGLATVMGSDADYDFYVAMVDYKRGEYSKAILQWEQLQEERPDSDTLMYFLGVAHLASGEEAKAIPFLEKTTQKAGSMFLNDAYYYLGLSHLKIGEIADAKAAFEKSSLQNSQSILSELKD